MNTLVIVESPTKARTIGKFLGKGYTVMASTGHVRDLPEHGLSVRVTPEGDTFRFDETYEISEDKAKIVSQLVTAARKADTILLASDPDREGEAIAWHLDHVIREKLGKEAESKTIRRIRYNEITHSAIRAALDAPRDIDTNLVNAQRYRRILDRFVGWKVSPALRNAGIPASVARTLSAGRVQSVALRMVCERDRAIDAFVPESFWKYQVLVHKSAEKTTFPIFLQKLDGKKADVRDEATHLKVVDFLEKANYTVAGITCEKRRRSPEAPFTTSQLQQAASSALSLTPKRTMSLAQELYQVGLITYMRTDGRSVAKEAQAMAARFIESRFGAEYAAPKSFENKAGAQGAHEGIRPTDPAVQPDDPAIPAAAKSLYRIIWERFIASQMKPAEYELTTVQVQATAVGREAAPLAGILTASVSKLLFPGFLKVVPERLKEFYDPSGKEADDRDTLDVLPPLAEDEVLTKEVVNPACKQTKPPARFNEASLIRAMEKEGIGRPATYAATIDTLEDRKYVTSDRTHKLTSTELGRKVVDFLVKIDEKTGHGLFYVAYTREMEAELDKVAHEWQGEDPENPDAPVPTAEDFAEVDWQTGLSAFYKHLLGWLDSTRTYIPSEVFRAILEKFLSVKTWAEPHKEQKRTYDDLKTVQDFVYDYTGTTRPRGRAAKVETYTFDPAVEPDAAFKPTLPQLRYLLSILSHYQEQVPGLEEFANGLADGCFPGRTDEDAVAIREALRTAFKKSEADPAIEAVITQLEQAGVVENDKDFYESLRDQVRRGRQLSPKQIPYLYKIFHSAGQAGLVKDYGPDLCTAIGIPWVEPEQIDREEISSILEALGAITTWEAPVARRGRTYDDQAFVSSVSEQFHSSPASLSLKQLQALEKMLARYASQIPNAPALMERYHIAAARRTARPAAASGDADGKSSGVKSAAPAPAALTEEVHAKIRAFLEALAPMKDDRFVKSVSLQYARKKNLTEKQIAALGKVLVRNTEKLPNAAAIIAQYKLGEE